MPMVMPIVPMKVEGEENNTIVDELIIFSLIL